MKKTMNPLLKVNASAEQKPTAITARYNTLDNTHLSPISGKPMKRMTCGIRGGRMIEVNVSIEDRIALPVQDA